MLTCSARIARHGLLGTDDLARMTWQRLLNKAFFSMATPCINVGGIADMYMLCDSGSALTLCMGRMIYGAG